MKHFNLRLSLAAILFCSVFSMQILAQESEPNNSIAEANELLINESISGDLGINPANDNADYFEVVTTQNGNLTGTLDVSSGLNGRLRLFSSNGSQLAISSSVSGPDQVSLTVDCLAPGTFYFFVEQNSGSGSYTLSNSLAVPMLTEDTEPNNTIVTAQDFLETGTSTTGHIGYTGDFSDYYGLLPGDDGNLTITADLNESLTARLRLQYKNGVQIAISSSGNETISTTASCVANDTIYAFVERIGGCGSYSLTFETDSPPANEQDIEPNNSIVQANVFLENGASTQGRMGYNGVGIFDNADYFGLLPGDDGNVTISAIFDETMSGRLRLQYKNGVQLAISISGTDVMTTANCIANDTIYAFVERISGCGSYGLTFETDSPPANEQDVEPNNSIAQTNVFLENGASTEGRMGYNGVGISDNSDYFGLLPGDDGNVTISAIFDETMTGRLRLQYKNGVQLGISSSGNDVSTTASCIANDTIYAFVERISGCGSYSLNFQTDSPPEHDQDIEPNNSIAQANIFLENGASTEGRVGYNGVGISDNSDYYGLIPGDDGNVTVSAIFDETMTGRLRLQYKNGVQIAISSSGNDIMATANCVANDTIYAFVERIGGCGSYDLNFQTEFPTYQNDTEPNNSIAESNPMVVGESVQGHLGYSGVGISDPSDYYSFEVVQAPFELDAKIFPADGLNVRLRLLNSVGTQLAITTANTEAFNMVETINTEGTYHIFIERLGGCGSYTLGDLCGLYPTVEATPPGPLNKCPEADVNLDATAGLAAYAWFNGTNQVGNMQQYAASSGGDYTVVGYDNNGCPDTSNVIVIAALNCDDGDPCTDDFCDTVEGCSNIFSGDDDDDGTCNNLDLCPNDPNKIDPGNCGCEAPEPGETCDDGDTSTTNDMVMADCVCVGQLLGCTDDEACNYSELAEVEDASCVFATGCDECDGNGGVTNNPEVGDACDDGDETTLNDVYTACGVCGGTAIQGCTDDEACNYDETATVEDESCLFATGCDVCDGNGGVANNPEIGDACDDGDMNTTNDVYTACDICEGTSIFDCPELIANIGDECDDGNDDLFPGTVNDNCECEPGMEDFDCPELMVNLGDACDDGDPTTEDDVYVDCDLCLGEPIVDVPSNNEPDGAELNTSDRLWGVPGWDTYEVGCATLSMPTCDGSQPNGDTWYKFIGESENQGILARPNPSDPNAANVDLVIQVFDSNLEPLSRLTEGTCAVDRSCFNNYGNGQIERSVPTGLTIGEIYFYRVYDANGSSSSDCNLLIDTKVKTYASHPIVQGCIEEIFDEHSWTIESPANLYNIPPVPVIEVKMVAKNLIGEVVAETESQDPTSPGGLSFNLSDFVPALASGEYTLHAQNRVKMMANGCISAFWSQAGPACETEIFTLDTEIFNDNESVNKIGVDIQMNIYPNPNTGHELLVKIEGISGPSNTVNLEIFDAFGKMVHQESYTSSSDRVQKAISFDGKLTSGLYFINANVNGRITTQKLIVE